MEVVCADVGSVKRGNFGWFARLSDGTEQKGSDIHELAEFVAALLIDRKRVAMGFEAPMYVPLRDDVLTLTSKRRGETNANWIGGPGASVLATGLVQVPWFLSSVRDKLRRPGRATLDWADFQSGAAELFLWEAFVSGASKGGSHIEDAEIAVGAFLRALPNPGSDTEFSDPKVLSLLGVFLLRTGWRGDVSVLSERCLVVKA